MNNNLKAMLMARAAVISRLVQTPVLMPCDIANALEILGDLNRLVLAQMPRELVIPTIEVMVDQVDTIEKEIFLEYVREHMDEADPSGEEGGVAVAEDGDDDDEGEEWKTQPPTEIQVSGNKATANWNNPLTEDDGDTGLVTFNPDGSLFIAPGLMLDFLDENRGGDAQ